MNDSQIATFESLTPAQRLERRRGLLAKPRNARAIRQPRPMSMTPEIWNLLDPCQHRQILILLDPKLQKRLRIMAEFFVSSATAKRDLRAVRRAIWKSAR